MTRRVYNPTVHIVHVSAHKTAHIHCAYRHCFNVVASTGQLGAFAGVLTALTFSAIIFLAGRKREDQSELENTLVLLFAAFVSMAMATYLFSSAFAEEGPRSRSSFLAFCASLAFSSALLLLFFGIVQLIRDGGFRNVHYFASGMARWVVGPVIFLFMLVTAVGARGVDQSTLHAWKSTMGFASLIFLLSLLAWVRYGRFSVNPTVINECRRWWIRLSVGIVLVAVTSTALWGEADANTGVPTIGYLSLILLLFVAICGYSSILKSLARQSESEGT